MRFTGSEARAAAARTRPIPGWAGSRPGPGFSMMRTPTVPSCAAHSATVSATAGSVGSTGLIRANLPGCAA